MVKNLPANAGDARDSALIPSPGQSPGEGKGNPLQHGGSYGQRSLLGYSSWGHKASDRTKAEHTLRVKTQHSNFPHNSIFPPASESPTSQKKMMGCYQERGMSLGGCLFSRILFSEALMHVTWSPRHPAHRKVPPGSGDPRRPCSRVVPGGARHLDGWGIAHGLLGCRRQLSGVSCHRLWRNRLCDAIGKGVWHHLLP